MSKHSLPRVRRGMTLMELVIALAIAGMMATRSPTLTSATSDPASTTRAENSWPRVCGSVAPVSGCGRTGVTIGPTRYS